MKKGFTLLEMLIVIGIIAILTGSAISGYIHVLRVGENARARELVGQAATALTALFNADGVWPEKIRSAQKAESGGGNLLDENVAYCLRKQFSVSVDSNLEQSIGNDRFGIVTPWAMSLIKRLGTSANRDSAVNGNSSIRQHILHFEVDLNGDGIIDDVKVGGTSISVRATAIVWCCNRDGEILDYAVGSRKDGIYSWTYGQTVNVK